MTHIKPRIYFTSGAQASGLMLSDCVAKTPHSITDETTVNTLIGTSQKQIKALVHKLAPEGADIVIAEDFKKAKWPKKSAQYVVINPPFKLWRDMLKAAKEIATIAVIIIKPKTPPIGYDGCKLLKQHVTFESTGYVGETWWVPADAKRSARIRDIVDCKFDLTFKVSNRSIVENEPFIGISRQKLKNIDLSIKSSSEEVFNADWQQHMIKGNDLDLVSKLLKKHAFEQEFLEILRKRCYDRNGGIGQPGLRQSDIAFALNVLYDKEFTHD